MLAIHGRRLALASEPRRVFARHLAFPFKRLVERLEGDSLGPVD